MRKQVHFENEQKSTAVSKCQNWQNTNWFFLTKKPPQYQLIIRCWPLFLFSLNNNFFFVSVRLLLGLTKKCKVREEKDYDYKKLMKISDIPGIQVSNFNFNGMYCVRFTKYLIWFNLQPSGYLVRFPFYVLAPRDAHIVFSPVESPNWTRDNVYEIC